MSIEINQAIGQLYVNEHNEPGAPDLVGTVRFNIGSTGVCPPLVLTGNGWLKPASEGEFAVNFCGLIGELIPDVFDKDGYYGTLGPGEAFNLTGKRKLRKDGGWYIELVVKSNGH